MERFFRILARIIGIYLIATSLITFILYFINPIIFDEIEIVGKTFLLYGFIIAIIKFVIGLVIVIFGEKVVKWIFLDNINNQNQDSTWIKILNIIGIFFIVYGLSNTITIQISKSIENIKKFDCLNIFDNTSYSFSINVISILVIIIGIQLLINAKKIYLKYLNKE
ncbi:MAG: hypothetical protein AB1444_16285 [Spirochaetota bacterium]